jgi:hypothetical protein
MIAMKSTQPKSETISAVLNSGSSARENSHVEKDSTPTQNGSGTPGWLSVGFWICFVIALAAAARRLIALARPSAGGSPMAGLDATFASHTALTLSHIIPATAFVLLAPFVLLRASGKKWLETALFLLGVIVGITAYAMSADAIGGWIERTAVLFFNSLFLYSLGRAFIYRQAGEDQKKHRWLTRAVWILLGIATTRPVMGVFFATSRLTHLEPKQFFGIAFWIGFSLNTIIVEMWLRVGNHAAEQYEIRSYL